MTWLVKFVPLAAALVASAALAQADPHAGHHPEAAAPEAPTAKPDAAPKSSQACSMMNGQAMRGGGTMGPSSKPPQGENGQAAMSGMMGRGAMNCTPEAQAQATPDPHQDQPAPKAK